MILYAGDCVAVTILPAFARRRSGEKCFVTRRAVIMASTTRVPLKRSTTPSAPEVRASQAHTYCGLLVYAVLPVRQGMGLGQRQNMIAVIVVAILCRLSM